MNVTRRTVLKAMGTALMAPIISLRSEIDRERLLLTFCDDESYRYDLTKPYGIGSLTYATDGILGRVPPWHANDAAGILRGG